MQQFLKILIEKNNQQRKIYQEDKSLIITKLKQKNLHTYNRRERKEFTFLSREETDLNSKARLKKNNPFRAREREREMFEATDWTHSSVKGMEKYICSS